MKRSPAVHAAAWSRLASLLGLAFIIALLAAPRCAMALEGGSVTDSLPDVRFICDDIPDDATVISDTYASLDDGTIVSLETGEQVSDPDLVGTVDAPADPLAITGGKSYETITVGEYRELMAGSHTLSLEDGSGGAYWGVYDGMTSFFSSNGSVFAVQAKGVIDVSEWQGTIDWEKAKADGVEGAIIRLCYGAGNGLDETAAYNISECKRLGIPFGVYVYSYAASASDGTSEGDNAAELLEELGVEPGDLSYPVYYDLEEWQWTGHTPPSSPSTYDQIVNAWYAAMQAHGYSNLSVYSYESYLSSALNSSNIHSKVGWVANYGNASTGVQILGFSSFSVDYRGWQYTSSGHVDGISGDVDLSAFGYAPGTESAGDAGSTGSTGNTVSTGNAYYFKNTIASGEADAVVFYGRASDVVFPGDWDGDGADTLAVRRDNLYYIKNSISGGEADTVVAYGKTTDTTLVGDWDGDGVDTLAVRRGNVYYVKNSIAGGEADKVVGYGKATDEVLVGDWDGDGLDTFCVRR